MTCQHCANMRPAICCFLLASPPIQIVNPLILKDWCYTVCPPRQVVQLRLRWLRDFSCSHCRPHKMLHHIIIEPQPKKAANSSSSFAAAADVDADADADASDRAAARASTLQKMRSLLVGGRALTVAGDKYGDFRYRSRPMMHSGHLPMVATHIVT